MISNQTVGSKPDQMMKTGITELISQLLSVLIGTGWLSVRPTTYLIFCDGNGKWLLGAGAFPSRHLERPGIHPG